MMRAGGGRVKLAPVLSEDALRRALAAAGLEAPVRYEDEVGSTNDLALELARSGAPEWTLVAAGHQTAGRGRLGRSWLDRPGAALVFSVVLRPRGLPPARVGLLPLLAGVAAAEGCLEAGAARVACKWPNDLLVGEAKAGGILAESRVEGGRLVHVVLGVGINLREPPAGVPGAAGVGDVDPEAVLSGFLRAFRPRYQPSHPAFVGAVLAAYRRVSATLGRRVRATTTRGATIEGLAVDVREDGGLVVETSGGMAVVAFGEVTHLDPA